MNPLITIIITVYNAQKYIEHGMTSLLTQTYKNIDFLIIDDGSTDGSSEILAEYAKKDSRIRILRRENGGVSAARNTGVENILGEWVMFADMDDDMPDTAVETLINAAVKMNVRMCVGSFTIIKGSGKRTLRNVPDLKFQSLDEMYKYFLTDGYDLNYLWGRIFKSDVFDDIRFPEGLSYQDMYTLPYVLKSAGSCALISDNVYNYYYIAGSVSHGKADRSVQAVLGRLHQYEFFEKEAPECLPFVKDNIINCCCLSMGTICSRGRKEHMDSWNQAVNWFKQYKKGAALRRPFEKFASAVFSVSPVLLGYLCSIYGKYNNN